MIETAKLSSAVGASNFQGGVNDRSLASLDTLEHCFSDFYRSCLMVRTEPLSLLPGLV